MAITAPRNPPTRRDQAGRKEHSTRWLLGLLALLLVIAPLFRAGLLPLASMALQLLALGILVAALWSARAPQLSPLEIALLAALPASVILYLIPLPAAWIDALPGRALYASATGLLTDGGASGWKPLSLNPTATLNAGLGLLVPLAVFIGCRRLDAGSLLRLTHLLLGIAAAEALLGLIQFGTVQNGQMLFAVSGGHTDSAIGTYANRNHLSGLLEMTLPLALALLFSSLDTEPASRTHGPWRRRAAAFLRSGRSMQVILYASTALMLLLGVIFSRSRMGIGMTMLGLVLGTLLFAPRIGGRNAFGVTGTIVALVLGLGLAIGMTPVLSRFSVESVTEDGRGMIFTATLTGIGERLPLGTGPGTIPDAMRAFAPVELGSKFFNHAHNDYLEWTSDVGLIAPALIALALLLYLRQWTHVYSRAPWTRARFLQAGAGIGLLLLALHELVDYNLATPANQAVFALLAGIFFMPAGKLDGAGDQRHRARNLSPNRQHTDRLANTAPDEADLDRASPPADQIENPFKD